MNEPLRESETVLLALAQAREALIRIAVELRKRPWVREVGTGVDCRAYQSPAGATLELCLDVELADGRAVAWMIDVAADGAPWTMEVRVHLNTADGCQALQEKPERLLSTADEFVAGLEEEIEAVRLAVARFSPEELPGG